MAASSQAAGSENTLLQTPFVSSHGTRVTLSALLGDKEYSSCGPLHRNELCSGHSKSLAELLGLQVLEEVTPGCEA